MDAEFNYIRKKQNKRYQFSPNFFFKMEKEEGQATLQIKKFKSSPSL